MHFASSIHLVVISKDKMRDKRRYVNIDSIMHSPNVFRVKA